MYFIKTCYIVHNLKKKSKPSPPFPSETLNPNTPLIKNSPLKKTFFIREKKTIKFFILFF